MHTLEKVLNDGLRMFTQLLKSWMKCMCMKFVTLIPIHDYGKASNGVLTVGTDLMMRKK